MYLVEVLHDNTGYQGEWSCARCGLSGQSSAKYSDRATAGAWANIAALVHNLACHAE